jgi:hypothetical protein
VEPDVQVAAAIPIQGDNLMYTMLLCRHTQEMVSVIVPMKQKKKGLPVFISECRHGSNRRWAIR